VIIEKAHTMNIPSQNAILKILEEPPLGTLFILITSNKGNLLPTILSRAFIVDFTSLKEKEMEEILKEEKNSTIKEILKADQSLRFWKFLKNETVLEIIEKIKNFKKLTHSEIIEIAEKSENIEEKENLIEILELLFYTQLKEGKISLKNYEAIEKILSQMKLGIKKGIKLKLAVETLLFISKIN
jgi:DNA polymerase-3 subunit delta'